MQSVTYTPGHPRQQSFFGDCHLPCECGRVRISDRFSSTMDTVQISSPLPLSSHAKPVDSFAQAGELENELKRVMKGEVRFDRGSRALYSSDGSNYRQIPIGLVVPRDDDDVIATVAACRKFGAPVLPRGGGTSLAGQTCNVAVILDFTKYMNKILEIDAAGQFARIQPG